MAGPYRQIFKDGKGNCRQMTIYKMVNNKRLNIFFVVELVLIGLVIFGYVPRSLVLYWTIVSALYVLVVPLEESVLFFVRSVPLFVAIPFTASFDSFNLWRILSVLIFLKWIFVMGPLNILMSHTKAFLAGPKAFIKHHSTLSASAGLILLALLSVAVAPDKLLAVKRIIYFTNLSLVGIVLYHILLGKPALLHGVIKNISIPVIVVILVGFFQLIQTYLMDIYQFVDIWTLTVEKNLFGSQWAAISRQANTWFAYFGDQLSLRMFSLFPDSHSFPIFLLLGLPAILAVSLVKIVAKNGGYRAMLRQRGRLVVLFVPLAFLAAILSGTRGIWAASLGAVLAVFLVLILLKKQGAGDLTKTTFKYVSSYIVLFFLLFSVAYPIIASPQFLVSKGDSMLLRNRVRSIIDFGETSNKERIRIWKLSLQSIVRHPLLGVGIGNFPVVLEQDLSLARAGSSAHNLYLHIAAEMGIPALLIALAFLGLLLKKLFSDFISASDTLLMIYFGAMLIYLPWVLIYSLTDPAIFDERAFLLFVITCALILVNKKPAVAGPET